MPKVRGKWKIEMAGGRKTPKIIFYEKKTKDYDVYIERFLNIPITLILLDFDTVRNFH